MPRLPRIAVGTIQREAESQTMLWALMEALRRSGRLEETIVAVISDHGNAPAVPFSWKVGMSLGQFIAAQLEEPLSLDEVFGRPEYALTKAHYLLDEMRDLEARLPPAVCKALRAVRRYVDRRVPPDPEAEVYDLERREDVVVRASGSLAHVYFNVTSRAIDLIEVGLLYPRLLDRLIAAETIGLVVGRAGERTVALGTGGGSAVITADEVVIDPPDPLSAYGDSDWVARQLHQLAAFPHSGDLILLGACPPDGRVVTFEEQVATHGGLGGGQEQAFIAYPPAAALDTVVAPQDLYRFFRERYGER